MVTFPVIAVVAADVAQATSSVSVGRGPRPAARLRRGAGHGPCRTPGGSSSCRPRRRGLRDAPAARSPAASLATIEQALGGHRPATELRQPPGRRPHRARGPARRRHGRRPADPLTKGLFRLTSGRFPTAPDEVAVNAALAGEGFADRRHGCTVGGRSRVTVVGTAESTGPTHAAAAGRAAPSWLPAPDARRGQPVAGGRRAGDLGRRTGAERRSAPSWSRATVIEHPPSTDQLPPQLRQALLGRHSQIYTVLRADRGDGAARGRAAGRAGVRRRRPATVADPGADRGERRDAAAVAPDDPGHGRRARLRRRDRRHRPRDRRRPGGPGADAARPCRTPGSGRSRSAGATCAASPPSGCSARCSRRSSRRGSPRGRTSWRCSPVGEATASRAGVHPWSAWCCSRSASGWRCSGARQGAGDLLIAAAAVVSVFGMIFLVPVVVVARGPARATVAAAAAVRRTRRGAAPHPHRAGRGRRGGDGRRRGRTRDRQLQRPGPGEGGVRPAPAAGPQLGRGEPATSGLGRGDRGGDAHAREGPGSRRCTEWRRRRCSTCARRGTRPWRAGSSSPYPTPALVSDGSDDGAADAGRHRR